MISPTVDRVAWLRARQLGITATDIAAICGLDPYRTPLDVWHEKSLPIDDVADAVDDTDVEAMEWGHRLEPMVAAKFADKHPEYEVRDSPGLISMLELNLTEPDRNKWCLATPDRILRTAPNTVSDVLEIKTAGARQTRAWDDDGTPDQHVVQLQWQLMVLGADRGFIAALIAGQRYVEREFSRDDELIAMLHARGLEFLSEHVHQGIPPEADPWRDRQLLSRVYEVDPTKTVQLSGEALTALDVRLYCKAQIEGLEHEIAEADAIVKQEMGDAEIGLDDNRVAVTWKQSTPKRFDQKGFKAAQPALYDQWKKQGKQRTYLVKEKKTDDS